MAPPQFYESPVFVERVHKYAEYLGISLDQYPELYSLMEQGLRAPLPAGWEIVQDGATHHFLNNVTGLRQKDHPTDETIRQSAMRQIQELGPRSPAPSSRRGSPSGAAFSPIRNRGDYVAGSATPAVSGSSSERARALRYMCYGFLLAVLLHASIAMAVFHAYSAETGGLPALFSALWHPPTLPPPPPAAPAPAAVAPAAVAPAAAAAPAAAPAAAEPEPEAEAEEEGWFW